MDALFTLKNARKHLLNLKDMVESGRYFEVDRITAYPNPRNANMIRNDLPNPLKYISPEVGAVAAEFRAVLDQLVAAGFEFRNGHAPPPPPKCRTQFPICKFPNDFRSSIKRDLAGLLDPDVAFIEKLQPYNGHQTLLLLKTLADAHKHRKNVYLRANDGVTLHGHALYADASPEYFFVLPNSGVRVPKSVQVNARFKGKITMEDGQPVIDVLEILQAEVSSVLESFNSYFNF
jgi:hypothetical protein